MNVALHAISLCAGHAGIDLGTSLASELADVGCRTVCYVERESYAAAALVARMEDAHLEQAPVYSDITTFDGRRWRGCVDIVLAGFPCQPFSVAGRRAGTEDERHLWPHVLRIFRESGARLLLLENVPGLISIRTLQHRSDLIAHLDLLDAAAQRAPRPRDRWKLQEHRDRLYGRLLREHGISALHYVLCGLEAIGAATAWGLFSAEEVGAPHERLRVFILAELAECTGGRGEGGQVPARQWAEGQGAAITDWGSRHPEHPHGEGRREAERGEPQSGRPDAPGGPLGHPTSPRRQAAEPGHEKHARDESRAGCRPMADPSGGLLPVPGRGPSGRAGAGPAGATVPNASEQGFQGGERPGSSGERDGATTYGPAPELHRALFPPPPNDLAGWIEYLRSAPGLEPAVRRGAHGLAHRLDELRGCGNGVLPIVAAYAFICLVCDLHARGEGGRMKDLAEALVRANYQERKWAEVAA